VQETAQGENAPGLGKGTLTIEKQGTAIKHVGTSKIAGYDYHQPVPDPGCEWKGPPTRYEQPVEAGEN